eukprot:6185780-Pleurochrysis_carterae.AAC.1
MQREHRRGRACVAILHALEEGHSFCEWEPALLGEPPPRLEQITHEWLASRTTRLVHDGFRRVAVHPCDEQVKVEHS